MVAFPPFAPGMIPELKVTAAELPDTAACARPHPSCIVTPVGACGLQIPKIVVSFLSPSCTRRFAETAEAVLAEAHSQNSTPVYALASINAGADVPPSASVLLPSCTP